MRPSLLFAIIVVNILLAIFVINILIPSKVTSAQKYEEKPKMCGYESCHKVDPTKLNIHIVAHTHDDVGWLKTVNQYYFGEKNYIQPANVNKIISSSVKALQDDPQRRFIYVETCFLWKWWVRQDEETKASVRSLIDEGRLEIIGGGWTMNDEAVTHYQSILDQLTWGFRRLNDTFGKCSRPKIGWQIDPFGHSREQASIFAQMGYDGLLFGRLDYQDKELRLQDNKLEMIWRASPSLGESSNLFTTILYNLYSPPPGYCFDILCPVQPLDDDPESPNYNIDRRAEHFLDYVDKQAKSYQTNNVILTMGGDFTHQEAERYFSSLDKLIKYINRENGSMYNAIYSTPSCYLKAVNEQNKQWSIKTDDFFPYADKDHSYWTGYYTSRPSLKLFERMGNNFLQVVKQLSVLNNMPDSVELRKYRQAMGILQHHDAVTGTEKQHVADDYAKTLSSSMHHGERITENALRKMILNQQETEDEEIPEFKSCLLLNISSCEYTENSDYFVVTLYNPSSQPLTTHVRLPVKKTSYQVIDHSGMELATQIVPVPLAIEKIPGRKSSAPYELVFMATGIPALGYESFHVSVKTQEDESQAGTQEPFKSQNSWSGDGNAYNISVDNTGKVVIQSKLQQNVNLTQSFHFYEGAVIFGQSSGAYLFTPTSSKVKNIPYVGSFKIFKGPLVEELQMNINKWVSQVIRVYKGEDRIELNWLVGPIDVKDNIGKEVITRYTTDLKTNAEFFTDSNGREMLKRKRNTRPTWDVNLAEPASGNYYPVTTKITLKDDDKQLKMAVFTDRSEGGSSLNDGEVELMVHRRLVVDDDRGVEEPLNETAYGTGLIVRGKHSLIIGKQSDSFLLKEKNEAIRLALRPWIFITPVERGYDEWNREYKMQSSGLAQSLPPNVHILTLEPWKDGSVLLRLEHLFELGESDTYSDAVEVNIQDLFSAFSVTSIRETTLGGNHWIEEKNRLKWIAEKSETSSNDMPSKYHSIEGMVVHLLPMQIRTFIITVSFRQ